MLARFIHRAYEGHEIEAIVVRFIQATYEGNERARPRA